MQGGGRGRWGRGCREGVGKGCREGVGEGVQEAKGCAPLYIVSILKPLPELWRNRALGHPSSAPEDEGKPSRCGERPH